LATDEDSAKWLVRADRFGDDMTLTRCSPVQIERLCVWRNPNPRNIKHDRLNQSPRRWRYVENLGDILQIHVSSVRSRGV